MKKTVIGAPTQEMMCVEITMLILTLIGTIATVVSTVIAVRAKNKAQEILIEVKSTKQNILTRDISISNKGENKGVMIGSNAGEVSQDVGK